MAANNFHDVQSMLLKLQEQEAELTAYRNAQVQAPAPGSTPVPEQSMSRAPLGREPKPFGGQREHLELFLDHLRLIFALQPHRFPTDKQRVLYTASYLEGAAFSWFQPLLTKDDENLLSDFKKFAEALVQTFGDAFLAENAEDRLLDLKQTTSVANFSSEFRRLAAHVRINEEGLVALFRRGLKPQIQDELAKIRERFTTVNAMSETAIRIDQRFFARKQIARSAHGAPFRFVPQGGSSRFVPHANRPSARETVSAPSRPFERDPNAMEIGSATRYKPLTTEEREHRIRQHLCLYCGKDGHVAKSCPNKVVRRVAATEREPTKNF